MESSDKWVNDVMQSIDGIKQANPSPDLFDKITSKLPQTNKVKIIPLYRLRWAVAAACAVIALNVYVFSSELQSDNTSLDNSVQLLRDYSFYNL